MSSQSPEFNPVVRPIHYLGSKLRLGPEIVEAVRKVARPGSRVCDLFAGSGSASIALARDFSVSSVDIQEYSRIICAAALGTATIRDQAKEAVLEALEQVEASALHQSYWPLIEAEESAIGGLASPELLAEIINYGSLAAFSQTNWAPEAVRGPLEYVLRAVPQLGSRWRSIATASWFFGGVYFSYRQAVEIDLAAQAIERLEPSEQTVAMAALLSAASDCVNTVGKQFAQPIQLRSSSGDVKRYLVPKVIGDRQQSFRAVFTDRLDEFQRVRMSHGGNRAFRSDFADFLHSDHMVDVAAVYADPPYTRDHYSRYYHVLETLALRDFPSLSRSKTARGTSGLRAVYREGRHQSPFCIKSKAAGAFEELFRIASRRGVPMVVSYSPYIKDEGGRPRMMSIQDLTRTAERHYRDVVVSRPLALTHSKLSHRRNHAAAPVNAELLITCR